MKKRRTPHKSACADLLRAGAHDQQHMHILSVACTVHEIHSTIRMRSLHCIFMHLYRRRICFHDDVENARATS